MLILFHFHSFYFSSNEDSLLFSCNNFFFWGVLWMSIVFCFPSTNHFICSSARVAQTGGFLRHPPPRGQHLCHRDPPAVPPAVPNPFLQGCHAGHRALLPPQKNPTSMSVWVLYDVWQIFSVKIKGSNIVRTLPIFHVNYFLIFLSYSLSLLTIKN